MVQGKEKIVVFVADDDSTQRKKLRESFKNAGIQAKIYSFDCEKKLMDSLAQSTASPDIIFLTFNLENEAAVTCLKRIRLKKRFTNVPVIVFSPFTYLHDIKAAFENGASLFIPMTIFNENNTKTLHAIFHPRWRRDLIKPNNYKFVLSADTEDADKLCWSPT